MQIGHQYYQRHRDSVKLEPEALNSMSFWELKQPQNETIKL